MQVEWVHKREYLGRPPVLLHTVDLRRGLAAHSATARHRATQLLRLLAWGLSPSRVYEFLSIVEPTGAGLWHISGSASSTPRDTVLFAFGLLFSLVEDVGEAWLVPLQLDAVHASLQRVQHVVRTSDKYLLIGPTEVLALCLPRCNASILPASV